MPRDWQAIVQQNSFTPVMRLVHLAFRQTVDHEAAIRAALLRSRRTTYEDELNRLAKQIGCNKKARLTTGPELTALNEASTTDAESMVNTYNYDLAIAIQVIKQENPKSNRATYASRLREWDGKRAEWKNAQVAMWSTLTAVSAAQDAFLQLNTNVTGSAKLGGPNPAAEPICQGWLNRGTVSLEVARNDPSPFHAGCPHPWVLTLNRAEGEEEDPDFCSSLWMGDTA